MTTIKLETKQSTMQTEAYWENLVKRSLCRFLLLAQLAKGRSTATASTRPSRKPAKVSANCEPTEAMVYSTMKELQDGGYVDCRMEVHQGRQRRVCWLTTSGEEAFRAAARVWQRMVPTVEDCIEQALPQGR